MFLENTQISAEVTVGEIQKLLGRSGASAVLLEYDKGVISAVSFKLQKNGGEIPFRLPCRWEAVKKMMLSEMAHPRYNRQAEYEAQAKRIAWRQIFRWIQAQLALVETSMVSMEEVFFPYIHTKDGTFYEIAQSKNFQLELK